jgi:hypothetical protein
VIFAGACNTSCNIRRADCADASKIAAPRAVLIRFREPVHMGVV